MSIAEWRKMPQSLEYGAQDDELAALRTRLRDTAAVLDALMGRLDSHFGGRVGPDYDWKQQEEARATLKRLKEEGLM